MPTYWEKLQDPRWQKKRLEAMEKSDFCCEICGDSGSMLQVHHKEYFKGHEPWEYGVNQLAVLCKSCHENQHSSVDYYKVLGSFLDVDGPFSRESVAFMSMGFIGYSYKETLDLFDCEDQKYLKILHEAGVKAKEHYFKGLRDA